MCNEKMILFLSASAFIFLITVGSLSMPEDFQSQAEEIKLPSEYEFQIENANTSDRFQLDNNTMGYMQKVNNIYVLEVVSNDPNVLKAEYEAGFIQGRLQKDQIPAARDNTWDGLALLDPDRNKSIPPNQREIAEIQNALVRNFNYTLNYVGNQSDAKLRERMTRLVFRLLGIYDGATKSSPRALDFGGTWLPKPDTFGPEEMVLNYETQTISFMDIYFLNAIPDAWDVVDNTQSTTKCSAFVKKTDSEILLAHNSWTCYLDKSMASAYFINGDYLALNPIPAGIIGSNTDFGYNNKGILFAETTLLANHTEPKVESLWMFLRSALAEQFADSLEEFYCLISLEGRESIIGCY